MLRNALHTLFVRASAGAVPVTKLVVDFHHRCKKHFLRFFLFLPRFLRFLWFLKFFQRFLFKKRALKVLLRSLRSTFKTTETN